jgi:hypothetical protein
MTQTSAGIDPIPPARKDDTEDVAWALSTAEAMHARGDRGDALKWLRRAAEAASEAQSDDRALELAKAAADLASVLGPTTNAPPPRPPPRPTSVSPATRASTPSQAPAAVYPATRPFSPGAARSPSIPATSSGTLQWSTARAVSPFTSIDAGAVEGPRADAAPGVEGSPEAMPDPGAGHVAAQDLTPLPGRSTSPSSPPPSERDTRPVDVNHPAQSGDTGPWPARVPPGDELGEPPDEKTRIGVPAYTASAKLATESTEDTPAPPLNPVVHPPPDPMLRPSQAMRVVVWRAVDGVHVAPQGTRVAAISVDAVLVALDPAADLAAWLSGK